MAGHVFVIRGTIRALACDAWLMPCDSRARNRRYLPDHLQHFDAWPEAPETFRTGEIPVLPMDAWPESEPRPWLVNVTWQGDGPLPPAGWYQETARQALRAALDSVRGRPPRSGRRCPLVALPLLGAGRGLPMLEAGQLLRWLLPVVYEQLDGLGDDEIDVAVVTLGAQHFAAAQQQRETRGGAWAALAPHLRAAADRLAELASAGKLALFLGAGTGVGAGLPSWKGLLGALADRAGIDPQLRDSLLDDRRDIRDQASFIEARLGGAATLQRAVCELVEARRHHPALAHALLAGLPVTEAVTTNYDQLFETAWAAAATEPLDAEPWWRCVARTSIIPHDIRADAARWLLKMHGCVSRPESIVLTRESYVRYSHQWAALEGILQATLLTRHMLFVGFSLRDDNFIRILDAVRRVVRPARPAGPDLGPYGTALMLGTDAVMQHLYEQDLLWVAVSPREEFGMDRAAMQAAGRQLEIFLDYLLSRTRDVSHLLDDRFESVLSADERRVKEVLRSLAALTPTGARLSPVWSRLEELLAALGHAPGR